MLRGAGLGNEFWALAMRNAAHVRNRVRSNSIDAIPFKLFFNQAPDLGGMRVFGAEAIVHIDSVVLHIRVHDGALRLGASRLARVGAARHDEQRVQPLLELGDVSLGQVLVRGQRLVGVDVGHAEVRGERGPEVRPGVIAAVERWALDTCEGHRW